MNSALSQRSVWTAGAALAAGGLSFAFPFAFTSIQSVLSAKVSALVSGILTGLIAPFAAAQSSASLSAAVFTWALGGIVVSEIFRGFLDGDARVRLSYIVIAVAVSLSIPTARVWGAKTGLFIFSLLCLLGKSLIKEMQKTGVFDFRATKLKPLDKGFMKTLFEGSKMKQVNDCYSEVFSQYRRMPRLLLVGPPGTGKTTFAEYIHYYPKCTLDNNTPNKVVRVHTSKLLGVDSLHTLGKIQALCLAALRNKCPIIIDEFDSISSQGSDGMYEEALRIFQESSKRINLIRPIIATTNYLNRIDPKVKAWFDCVVDFSELDDVNFQGVRRYYVEHYADIYPDLDKVVSKQSSDYKRWTAADVESYVKGIALTKNSEFFKVNFRPSGPSHSLTPAPEPNHPVVKDERISRKARNKSLIKEVMSILSMNFEELFSVVIGEVVDEGLPDC